LLPINLTSGSTPPPSPGRRIGRLRHSKGLASTMSFTVPPGPLSPVYRLDDFRTALPPQPVVDDTQVWGEVMAAAQLFGALREAGMSVRFESEGPNQPPRVCITDLHGAPLREVPPAIACDPAALEAELLAPAASGA
jgi:hypothetical protein